MGSGGKKTFKQYLKSEHTHRQTDGQTDGQINLYKASAQRANALKRTTTNAKFLTERQNTFLCKIKSPYTINNLCVIIEIIASYFSYVLKMMSRNTLSEPQPEGQCNDCRTHGVNLKVHLYCPISVKCDIKVLWNFQF